MVERDVIAGVRRFGGGEEAGWPNCCNIVIFSVNTLLRALCALSCVQLRVPRLQCLFLLRHRSLCGGDQNFYIHLRSWQNFVFSAAKLLTRPLRSPIWSCGSSPYHGEAFLTSALESGACASSL